MSHHFNQIETQKSESVLLGGMLSRPLMPSVKGDVLIGRESMAHRQSLSLLCVFIWRQAGVGGNGRRIPLPTQLPPAGLG
jgi:hypothetical protein